MTAARYETWRPRGHSKEVVAVIRDICTRFRDAGLPLTVSQAYYQLVAAGTVDCSIAARKRFGVITARARLAGLLDWGLLVDSSCRFHPAPGHLERRAEPITAGAEATQRPVRTRGASVEVWTEKESIATVVTEVTDRRGVSWVSCRGLPSLTALQEASRRYAASILSGYPVAVLLLVDHDDQGIAIEQAIGRKLQRMTATHWIDARLDTLGRAARHRGADLRVVQTAMAASLDGRPGLRIERVALTAAQITRQQLPPNPDGAGHELEAANPLWLRTTLDDAVANLLDYQPAPAPSPAEESHQ